MELRGSQALSLPPQRYLDSDVCVWILGEAGQILASKPVPLQCNPRRPSEALQ